MRKHSETTDAFVAALSSRICMISLAAVKTCRREMESGWGGRAWTWCIWDGTFMRCIKPDHRTASGWIPATYRARHFPWIWIPSTTCIYQYELLARAAADVEASPFHRIPCLQNLRNQMKSQWVPDCNLTRVSISEPFALFVFLFWEHEKVRHKTLCEENDDHSNSFSGDWNAVCCSCCLWVFCRIKEMQLLKVENLKRFSPKLNKKWKSF